MRKAFSLMVFIVFFTMLASVANKVEANNGCEEALGACPQCDERCKGNHGPTAKGVCDRRSQQCTCHYTCGPSPVTPQSKQCYGGAGVCGVQCGSDCCNQNCAQKFSGGSGFCDSIGHTYLCKCQYPC